MKPTDEEIQVMAHKIEGLRGWAWLVGAGIGLGLSLLTPEWHLPRWSILVVPALALAALVRPVLQYRRADNPAERRRLRRYMTVIVLCLTVMLAVWSIGQDWFAVWFIGHD